MIEDDFGRADSKTIRVSCSLACWPCDYWCQCPKMLQLLNDIVNAPPPASYQRRSRKSKPEDEGRRARKKTTTRGQVSPIHEDDTRRHSDGATNIGRHRFDNETQRHPAAPGQLPRIMSARAPFSIDGPDLKAHHAEQLDLNCSDEEQTSQEQPLNATSSPPLPFAQEITGQMPAKKQNSHPRPRPQFASDLLDSRLTTMTTASPLTTRRLPPIPAGTRWT